MFIGRIGGRRYHFLGKENWLGMVSSSEVLARNNALAVVAVVANSFFRSLLAMETCCRMGIGRIALVLGRVVVACKDCCSCGLTLVRI
jgi:hypothetical protein